MLLAGVLILFGFGQALGARGHAQRAADLAAVSAAQVMGRNLTRLYEPALVEGRANPRHLSSAEYLSLARSAALRGARANGVEGRVLVRFPRASLAHTRVTVAIGERAEVTLSGRRRERIPVRASATAEVAVDGAGLGVAAQATGGGYSGPLSYRQGKPMRPDVAAAFDRMAAAAEREANLALLVTSGYRSDAEQARLFAAHPDPKWVAPPGHQPAPLRDRARSRTAVGVWLAWANATGSASLRRYAWEPWHFGYALNAGSASVGFGGGAVSAAAAVLPQFVPALPRPLAKSGAALELGGAAAGGAALRRVRLQPAGPQRRRGGGHRPVHAGHGAGARPDDPFDAPAAIDAQAHLMRDLLRRFGSVPLALAAYNAGSAPVAACMSHSALSGDPGVRHEDPRSAGRRGRYRAPKSRGEIGRVKRNRPGTSLFNALNPSGGCMTRAARQAAARRGGCRLWVLGGGNHGRNLRTLLSG